MGSAHEAGRPRPTTRRGQPGIRRGGNGASAAFAGERRRVPQHQVRRAFRPGRQERRRPGHGPSRLRLHRPDVQQRHHHRRRPRSRAPADGRVHRLPAQHADRPPPDPRRPAPRRQRPQRLAHAGVPEPPGLLRGVPGRQASRPRGELRLRDPGLRHLPTREAGRDRVHAGRRDRAAPHLVHGRPLRVRLDPLRRFHGPHPGRRGHVRPAAARGRRALVASRHVARRLRDADLAEGSPLRPPPRPRRGRPRVRAPGATAA